MEWESVYVGINIKNKRDTCSLAHQLSAVVAGRPLRQVRPHEHGEQRERINKEKCSVRQAAQQFEARGQCEKQQGLPAAHANGTAEELLSPDEALLVPHLVHGPAGRPARAAEREANVFDKTALEGCEADNKTDELGNRTEVDRLRVREVLSLRVQDEEYRDVYHSKCDHHNDRVEVRNHEERSDEQIRAAALKYAVLQHAWPAEGRGL